MSDNELVQLQVKLIEQLQTIVKVTEDKFNFYKDNMETIQKLMESKYQELQDKFESVSEELNALKREMAKSGYQQRKDDMKATTSMIKGVIQADAAQTPVSKRKHIAKVEEGMRGVSLNFTPSPQQQQAEEQGEG